MSTTSDIGRTDDPVRMYLREMGSVELLSREGEIAIAKRIEAGRDMMIGGICESPLTVRALLLWRDALERKQDAAARHHRSRCDLCAANLGEAEAAAAAETPRPSRRRSTGADGRRRRGRGSGDGGRGARRSRRPNSPRSRPRRKPRTAKKARSRWPRWSPAEAGHGGDLRRDRRAHKKIHKVQEQRITALRQGHRAAARYRTPLRQAQGRARSSC